MNYIVFILKIQCDYNYLLLKPAISGYFAKIMYNNIRDVTVYRKDFNFKWIKN